jgi:hypothetical protein
VCGGYSQILGDQTVTLSEKITAVLTDPEVSTEEKMVLSVLTNHVGGAHSILRRDVAAQAGLNLRVVRATVKRLIEKRGIPIASSPRPPLGHYIICTEYERTLAKRDLLSRARSLQMRAFALDNIRFANAST